VGALEKLAMFKTVLFPVDRSREAREAAEVVIEIVNTYSSRLVLLSVVEESVEEGEILESPMTSEEAIAELLKNAQNLFADRGIQSETMEREGKPAFTICDVADEIDADLIIMGSRGLGLTDEGAADSVTNRVINLAPCPVLVVP
jgi:nucleotide-binding universal stress UspA family protein